MAVELSADLECQSVELLQGCTPLHGCAETHEHKEMLRTHSFHLYLLEDFADRGAAASLHAAAEVAGLLVHYGADPATQNKQVVMCSHSDSLRVCLNSIKLLHDLSGLAATLLSYKNLCINMCDAACSCKVALVACNCPDY